MARQIHAESSEKKMNDNQTLHQNNNHQQQQQQQQQQHPPQDNDDSYSNNTVIESQNNSSSNSDNIIKLTGYNNNDDINDSLPPPPSSYLSYNDKNIDKEMKKRVVLETKAPIKPIIQRQQQRLNNPTSKPSLNTPYPRPPPNMSAAVGAMVVPPHRFPTITPPPPPPTSKIIITTTPQQQKIDCQTAATTTVVDDDDDDHDVPLPRASINLKNYLLLMSEHDNKNNNIITNNNNNNYYYSNDDISQVMKRRAQSSYGMTVSVNVTIFSSSSCRPTDETHKLYRLWKWIDRMERLVVFNNNNNDKSNRVVGGNGGLITTTSYNGITSLFETRNRGVGVSNRPIVNLGGILGGVRGSPAGSSSNNNRRRSSSHINNGGSPSSGQQPQRRSGSLSHLREMTITTAQQQQQQQQRRTGSSSHLRDMTTITNDDKRQRQEQQQPAVAEPQDVRLFSSVLDCFVYDSPLRRRAMDICGWNSNNNNSSNGQLTPSTTPLASSPPSTTTTPSPIAAVVSHPNTPDDDDDYNQSFHYFERRAFLSVINTDYPSAVSYLRQGATSTAAAAAATTPTPPSSSDATLPPHCRYAKTLALIAMYIDRYAIQQRQEHQSAASCRMTWDNLLQRKIFQEIDSNVAYLRAICAFLSTVGSSRSTTTRRKKKTNTTTKSSSSSSSRQRRKTSNDNAAAPTNNSTAAARDDKDDDEERRRRQRRLDSILFDNSLLLSDRLAFACRFLPQLQLCSYLDAIGTYYLEQHSQNNELDGLLLFGLNDPRGLMLLQSYVDRTGDVQTAALVTSRVMTLSKSIMRREWIEDYRELLNTWQLWTVRAKFDVERKDMRRKWETMQQQKQWQFMRQQQQQQQQQKQQQSMTKDYKKSSSSSLPSSTLPPSPPSDPPLPRSLHARCNYCNTPLPLSLLRQNTSIMNSWLSRQKPSLSCCPRCKKPLPRCVVCHLPMSCLNPYIALKAERDLNRKLGRGGGQGRQQQCVTVPVGDEESGEEEEDLKELAVLPLAEWMAWCTKCQHGGHAFHLKSWFERNEVCPVANCHCRCRISFGG